MKEPVRKQRWDPAWFSWSGPLLRLGRLRIRPWNLYNRSGLRSSLGTQVHWWGVGIVQIGHRHLFFVGDQGLKLFFLGTTR